jgi:UDP-N-acetyl-2-amino-2-deoxyglucuronate dehydrogenase
MAKGPVSIAVIGCGRIAGHHCRSILKQNGLRLSAVCDLVNERASAYGKEFSVPFYANYREMLKAHPEVEVVVVATPSGMHSEHALEMIEKFRKHVIVEKPTFMRPTDLELAYAAAAKAGVAIFPVFQNRYNRAIQRVKTGLESGELGKPRIISVRVRWCRPQRYYDLAPWRGTFAQDGGALTNQGVHHVDLLRYFGGEAKRVLGLMKTMGAEIEVEDSFVGTVEFVSGAIGSLEITTAARPDDFEASLSLVCEKGLAQVGGIAVNELQIYTPDPSACLASSEDFSKNVYGHGHEKLYEEVSRFFTEGWAYSVSQRDCHATLSLLHSFYRSDEDQAWVALDRNLESSRLGKPDESLSRLYRI